MNDKNTDRQNQNPPDFEELEHLKQQMTTAAHTYIKQMAIVQWCGH